MVRGTIFLTNHTSMEEGDKYTVSASIRKKKGTSTGIWCRLDEYFCPIHLAIKNILYNILQWNYMRSYETRPSKIYIAYIDIYWYIGQI